MKPLDYKSLLGPLLIWLAVVAAGVVAAVLRGNALEEFWKAAAILAAPALLSLLLSPAIARRGVQAIILLIWAGFGIIGCLIAGVLPTSLVFLTVPAIGMLFKRERVIEGLFLAAAALLGTVLSLPYLETLSSPLTGSEETFLRLMIVAASLALTIAAMIGGTQSRDRLWEDRPVRGKSASATRWRDGVAGGLFEFDEQNRLVGASPQGRRQFSLNDSRNTLTLETLSEDETASSLITETVDAARRLRKPADARLTLNGSNDLTVRHIDMRATPTQSGGVLLHTIDRTDDEARIELLRRSNTVAQREAEEKTLFFAGVSHELRTPLNAIIGFSDMMRSRLFGPLPGKYAEYADLIHDSGQYMLDLIGDVLDLSKVEAGKYQLTLDTFDASDVIRSSVKMIRPVADQAEVALDVDLPDDVLLMTADRKAVRQILLNLLSNAVKFSPKGSRVKVSVHETDDPVPSLSMTVSDSGSGMSAEEVARIGEPFAQGASSQLTESRGSGLGLSLVQSLVDLHDGTFKIDSELGKGTNARVTIPITVQAV